MNNIGDTHLSAARDHLDVALQLLHKLVGTRDIETAIACCKLASMLVDRARYIEQEKRHVKGRDELR